MSQNDDHIGQEGEDPSRTLDAVKPLYELGSHIGSYKLLRILGEGGFGIVYLAEQQRPIKRQVALKIIKPGMDSAQVIRRFEAERQALALLDHPNVAHVYDAGTTEAGRPYFAMEYVKGVPITEHCDRQRLTIEERLKLFVKVCEAIQHAHQKGIIHRDIKPSNIQVCIHGEQVVPKVIDFGVAKALSQPLTERTLVTEQGQLIGTPEYMSPEQAEMTNQDIDTRSDIYSLGVLLYELLTRTLPFESQTLRRGSLEQMREIIREAEPRTPSIRVGSLDVQASTKLARCCQSDAASLRRKLHGDLDWITLKAMEKDRMRRYQTAHALAEDIERHLNNEPVLAGRPGTLYRFQKLVRRNTGVFAAVAAVGLVLVLGVIVSTWQAVRATRAERTQTRLRHEAETARTEETAQRRKAEALAYASDMSLAQQALAMNDLGRAQRLLEDHRPGPGEVDLRGWEWRYLWQECRSDALGELCRYPPSPFSVAYSPNGNVLAVAGLMQEFVEIWDVPAHKRITTLQPKEGRLVAFSPHGDLLAAGAGNQIRLWRTGPWNRVGQLTVPGSVNVIKFSPDGTRLASLSHPDEVTVWEVDQWAVVRGIHGVRPAGALVGRLDFSPDSKALVIGDAAGQLRVVDLTSGNTDVNIPEAHSEGITSVAWSPNGSVIASGSGYSGGPIKLWDAASGKPLGALEGHNSWICNLIFSTDGLRLYSSSGDQTIRVWDVEQRQCLATLRGSTDEVYGLALSPDGTTLASACKDGIVAFWSALAGPQEESPRLFPLGRFWPAFAPDSRVLAAPRAGTVSLFDLATLREIEQLPALGTDGVDTVAYSPDGTLLVSGSTKGRIRVWSCTERRLLRELDGHRESMLMLCFRADGTRLLSVDAKGTAIWWDTLTWQPARTVVVELAGAGNVSPDGRLTAMGAAGAMRWWNAETGELLATTTGGHRRNAKRVVFSGDGSRVASVATDGTVALWDPSSFQLIAAFKGHANAAHGAAFSPDGRRLATGGGSRDPVKLWDLSTHRELMTLSGQGSAFSFVDFSPDGRWLAACSGEGRLHLWFAPSWEEIEAAEKRQKSTQSP
ncbi:MAG: serine/threonine protein kinase [Phycisphaerae bacterium]|nr:serine/threonine protein kinase [Phycisphaerae bacterium]